jgi:ketol-acid reductoisomerase
MAETRFYRDEDADFSLLEGKTLAVVGYGSQGRSQALNLRDTADHMKLNANVIVANIEDNYRQQAVQDGFEVYSVEQGARKADIILLLLPDEVAPAMYKECIHNNLREKNAIAFASGYSITFHLIEPPPIADTILVAPRMGGKEVRELYVSGEGFPSFVAVGQDRSGSARQLAVALASAIGSGKGGSSVSVEVTFEQETLSDLLTEQFLSPLITAAWVAKYEIDVQNGVPPEAALLELHLSREWSEDFRRMAEMGMIKQLPLHSPTSQYGQLTRWNELMRRQSGLNYAQIKTYAQEKADEITSGRFAREWGLEQQSGYIVLRKMYEEAEASEMIRKEQALLSMLRKGGADR